MAENVAPSILIIVPTHSPELQELLTRVEQGTSTDLTKDQIKSVIFAEGTPAQENLHNLALDRLYDLRFEEFGFPKRVPEDQTHVADMAISSFVEDDPRLSHNPLDDSKAKPSLRINMSMTKSLKGIDRALLPEHLKQYGRAEEATPSLREASRVEDDGQGRSEPESGPAEGPIDQDTLE